MPSVTNYSFTDYIGRQRIVDRIASIKNHPVFIYVFRQFCFIHKDRERLEKTTSRLQQENDSLHDRISALSNEKIMIEEKLDATELNNDILAQQAAKAQEQARLAREEVERQIAYNQMLNEKRAKTEELEALETKLRIEKIWGESLNPLAACAMGLGAIIAGPLGFTIAYFAGTSVELIANRKKHLNNEYFKDLFETQKKVKNLARELGKSYPKDLEQAWWNQKQSVIGAFFGRDFGFQHRYQP
jgi:hypothetical protein